MRRQANNGPAGRAESVVGKRGTHWTAERVLLACLLLLGLAGLVLTYGNRVANRGDAASLPDSLRLGGLEARELYHGIDARTGRSRATAADSARVRSRRDSVRL